VSGFASKPLGCFRWFGLKTGGDGYWWFDLKTCCDGFLQFDLKTGGDRFSRFGLKTDSQILGWASKLRWWMVFRFGPQNSSYGFGDLGLKITATVSWFGHQNQADFGLSVAPQNWRREVNAGHASRFSSFLRVEVSLVRIFQSGLKTDGGAMAGGARGTIAEVVSEASWKRMGRCDELRQTLMPYLYRF
jgi:hypothetical protein